MKLIGLIVSAAILLTVGYLACYYNWLPQIAEFFQSMFQGILEAFR